jgi:hypothetical protein
VLRLQPAAGNSHSQIIHQATDDLIEGQRGEVTKHPLDVLPLCGLGEQLLQEQFGHPFSGAFFHGPGAKIRNGVTNSNFVC